MLKYLIIQLCDSAPSFCHYLDSGKEPRLISLEDLRKGILFAMKENLNIQFIYPDYELPKEYHEAIDQIDHADIISKRSKDRSLLVKADVIIIDSWEDVDDLEAERNYVVRSNREDFFRNYKKLIENLPKADRINLVFTDIPSFKDEDFERYKEILAEISASVANLYVERKTPNTNILTDRLVLKAMNNCNAGNEAITLAPDGKFYICPAFYLQGSQSEGDLKEGLKIKNSQLFKLSHAPICRKCDAYQCKRCVWLNELQTLEVNTPGREQCVVSHLERNQSRRLLAEVQKHGLFMPEIEIKEIDYLDPFEIVRL